MAQERRERNVAPRRTDLAGRELTPAPREFWGSARRRYRRASQALTTRQAVRVADRKHSRRHNRIDLGQAEGWRRSLPSPSVRRQPPGAFRVGRMLQCLVERPGIADRENVAVCAATRPDDRLLFRRCRTVTSKVVSMAGPDDLAVALYGVAIAEEEEGALAPTPKPDCRAWSQTRR